LNATTVLVILGASWFQILLSRQGSAYGVYALNILVVWLVGLPSIGSGGGSIVYEWYEELGLSYLVGGVAMVLVSLLVTLSAYRSCVARMNPNLCVLVP